MKTADEYAELAEDSKSGKSMTFAMLCVAATIKETQLTPFGDKPVAYPELRDLEVERWINGKSKTNPT